MYAVTGASGLLGRLVLSELLNKTDPGNIIALARDPTKLSDLAAEGVIVRPFDYNDVSTLGAALVGVDRLLLISSSEIGRRVPQHRAVIEAAKAANVDFIAYTSVLHADTSPLGLAAEHRATETTIQESGLSYALLRNGWYLENYTLSAGMEIVHGAVIGSTGEARISAASRADYAAAAAKVLLDETIEKRIYELAGDDSFTLSDYAATLAEISGKPVAYQYLPEDAFRGALQGIGLPAEVARMVADSSASAANGALFDDKHALSSLIGRPTTKLSAAISAALA
ncbi:SDR family oxidoreductase [Tardiphaga robiniae]|uniref:SDR family oxidoreductase n=1 Tax=Tardiphaga robiniae TaxID=943830 RepID=A0A7G6U1F2_9BRAD|nr:SDR family oxidoreductase [Tardiphaga robiniae]QND72834.1 SDR family oxidoreductase [Tardiphaga robiniae]